jgi:hypothetical protein
MAQRLLRLLGTRYGLALIGVVLVVAVVSAARLASGPQPVESVGPPPPVATAPSSTDELGDDSIATSESPAVATSIAGAPSLDAVALDFARTWMRSKGVSSAQWVKGMEPYSTRRLLTQFENADPESVPADGIRGPVQIRARDAQLAEVDVPVNPGTLKLRLLVTNGRWLVDAVSWERS